MSDAVLSELRDLRHEVRDLRAILSQAIGDAGSWVSVAAAARQLGVSSWRLGRSCREAWLDRPDPRASDVRLAAYGDVRVRYLTGPADGRKLYHFKVWMPDCRPSAGAGTPRLVTRGERTPPAALEARRHGGTEKRNEA